MANAKCVQMSHIGLNVVLGDRTAQNKGKKQVGIEMATAWIDSNVENESIGSGL